MMTQRTAVQAPSKALYKKYLPGYLGNGYSTNALVLKRNAKTVRIAVWNCRTTRFEYKNVDPNKVCERLEDSMIDEMDLNYVEEE